MHAMLFIPEMFPYKIVNNNKSPECIQYYLHTFFLRPVYYGNQCHHLKNNKKGCIYSLHWHIFLWLPISIFLWKIWRLPHNYSNYLFREYRTHIKWKWREKLHSAAGKVTMHCRRDCLYSIWWKRQCATHLEARTKKTLVGIIMKAKNIHYASTSVCLLPASTCILWCLCNLKWSKWYRSSVMWHIVTFPNFSILCVVCFPSIYVVMHVVFC